MWQDEQLIRNRRGKRWHFRIWHHTWTEDRVLTAERLFFWDDKKASCGVVLFPPGREVHFSRLKQLMAKLVAHSELRAEHERELHFPLERHYSNLPVFPEEADSESLKDA